MTVAYKIDRIAGESLALMPPPHGFPVEPTAWWVPLTNLGGQGATVTDVQDVSGNNRHLTEFGPGGKTLADDGLNRYAVLDTTNTQRLQIAETLTTPATVVGLTRVPAAANANLIQVGGYMIQRAQILTRLTVMDVGKTSTQYTRLENAGTDWVLWAAVLNGAASSLRTYAGASVGAGTLVGDGTTGQTHIAGNSTATPVHVAELAILPGALTTAQVTTALETVAARHRALL